MNINMFSTNVAKYTKPFRAVVFKVVLTQANWTQNSCDSDQEMCDQIGKQDYRAAMIS